MALAALLLTAMPAGAGTNLILNGDFEINRAPAGESQLNLTNAQFTALVANVTAFGSNDFGNGVFGELDLYTTDSTYTTAPQSGSWKVSLHSAGYMMDDAFSFSLASPVMSGASYQLSFWVSGLPNLPNAFNYPIQVAIGLSNDPGAFGTLLYTSSAPNGNGEWHLFNHGFVAPSTASYVTVRNVSGFASVDNFTLTPVPEPETWALLLAGLGLVGWRLQRRPRQCAKGPE
jgi:hypothetical protein